LLPNFTTHAGSSTWNLNPASGDWSTAANWTPATVPNGPSDIATFAASNTTNLSLSATATEVASIAYNPGASSFNITVDPVPASSNVVFTISGTGITNNSGTTQSVTIAPTANAHAGIIEFLNSASAGSNILFTVSGSATSGAVGGGLVVFDDTSTAGTATFVANGALAGNEADGGRIDFNGRATAASASFTINGASSKPGFAYGGKVNFFDSSSAGDAVFVINPGNGGNGGFGEIQFIDHSTAGKGTFTLNSSSKPSSESAHIYFNYSATAGNGLFTVNGGRKADVTGATIQFFGSPPGTINAGTATIINNGGNGAGSIGGYTSFYNPQASASEAVLIANGGVNGGGGGLINFYGEADGGKARIELFGNGTLFISDLANGSGIIVGSIEGDGLVKLGNNPLFTGSNDLSTTFSGTIQDAGTLIKIGNGTLSLSSANTYTGGTSISAGTLLVKNTTGSATGTGTVQTSGGTLGGRGIIIGPTIIGTGNGDGGSLQPGKGSSTATTLTIQNTLTFQNDGTYTWKLNTKKAKADQVIANGVTIESGAQFSFNAVANETLTVGKVFTAISNTAATPISGTFSNLADGFTFTVGSNTFLASYEGGDGNDLTLTVVQ